MSDHAARPAAPDLDLMPMIDVTFLLLVFFLCTLSFKPLEGRLEALLPKGAGPNAGRAAELVQPLELLLAPDPTRPHGVAVRVDGRGTLDLAGLQALVRRLVAQGPDLRARLATAPGTTHGMVVAVLDACLAAGLAEVGFAPS